MAVIELAVALAAIATKSLVSELIKGGDVGRDSWAEIGAEVVGAMMTTASRQSSGVRELSRQIDELGHRIDAIPQREFDQHMAAGRRYLRDLPVQWRTKQDRRELIRDARTEFVRAVAIAELRNDVTRQAIAEVALAACWLWVPSLDDVRNTTRQARMLLENEILFGGTRPIAAFADVLKLAKAYGDATANSAMPITNTLGRPALARLTVRARPDRWVECAGVELKLGERVVTKAAPAPFTPRVPDWMSLPPADHHEIHRTLSRRRPSATSSAMDNVTVKVRNHWNVRISLSLAEETVVAQITHNGTLPEENRVEPSGSATFTLSRARPTLPALRDPRPSFLSAESFLPPTIGFQLPRQPVTRAVPRRGSRR